MSEMGKFRKKPVVISAWQIQSYLDLPEISTWVRAEGGQMTYGQESDGPAYGLISTLEGVHRADVFDWVIQGVAGEFYPCKPDIFEMTYEEAS